MFRIIGEEDKDIFLALSREFYSSEAVLSPIPEEYHERTWNELMRSNTYLSAYIFESKGKPAGYSLLNRTFQHEAGGIVIWIEELFVRSEFRSQGIGRSFIEFLKENQKDDFAWFRLEIEPDNKRAAELYRRTGFESLPYSQMVMFCNN